MNKICRCHGCNGTKKVVKMGFISHVCDVCSGVGYIKEIETPQVTSAAENKTTDIIESDDVTRVTLPFVVPRKRGRPKRLS